MACVYTNSFVQELVTFHNVSATVRLVGEDRIQFLAFNGTWRFPQNTLKVKALKSINNKQH